jgi:DNA polymerase III alpha subunit
MSPDYFRHASIGRAGRTPGAPVPQRGGARHKPQYVRPAGFRINTILKMGFDYFLIVGDFINWAKK